MTFRCATLILLVLIAYCDGAFAQKVVVNPSVKLDTLTPQDLRAIFSKKMTRWPDNSPIVVFTLQNMDEEHKNFCRQLLNIFPYQLQRAWDRLVYSGIGQAPIKLNSTAEMKKQLVATPGSIGYLPETSDIGSSLKQIKIITTD